jgi:DNA-binding transcriptional regulator YiaG
MNESTDFALWRARLGLGREKMAQYLGVSVHTLNKWENGTRTPSDGVQRYFEVLQMVETLCPDLHAQIMLRTTER